MLNIALHPPLVLAVASQVANSVFTDACVWHDATVVVAGPVKLTRGAGVTVKVALVVCGVWQLLVTVKVTVVAPPQADGAPVLLLVNIGLQPPLVIAVANHAANSVFTDACVWQLGAVMLAGPVKLTRGAAGTVKVSVLV